VSAARPRDGFSITGTAVRVVVSLSAQNGNVSPGSPRCSPFTACDVAIPLGVYNPGMDPERLSAVCRSHGVRLLLQFGSTVSNQTHAASDVDLAVLFERRPASLGAYGALVGDLQALVPDREVDLAVINGADPLFLKQITEQCRLLYGSERALRELQIYAFKRYQDHRRFLAMERVDVREKIRTLAR
jgi:uncharacterized protein